MTPFVLGVLSVKQAAQDPDDVPNVFEGSKKVTDFFAPKDKTLHVPTLDRRSAQSIVDAMASASKYDSLKDVRVGLGKNNLKNYTERLKANPRVWNIIKGITPNSSESPLGPFKAEDLGDFYAYHSHDVNLPSKNPGILVHELGHAVDFNEHPADSNIRGFIGGTYRKFAPTLWKEHVAWNKGKSRFLEGAANKKLDPKFVQDVLQAVEQTRPIGLGSYWGGRLGGIGGLALGAGGAAAIASQTKMFPLPLAFVGGGLGTLLGINAGTAFGRYFGHAKERASEKERQQHLNSYADAIAKKYDMTREEALQEIQNMMTKQKKKRAA